MNQVQVEESSGANLNFKVADLNLAEFGRLEMNLAQKESLTLQSQNLDSQVLQ